ncbi:hypothetical protein PLANPX_4081 [Lacipirellula parvula]|uniref:Uncharacterized protein n=1 Tax=Lacipirellula parvula TaxID=2650471 RepID=A0A5K7XMX0_9BACT|nr:hypothetical protein PLANPX_4081 [Lacipirellula parvula]
MKADLSFEADDFFYCPITSERFAFEPGNEESQEAARQKQNLRTSEAIRTAWAVVSARCLLPSRADALIAKAEAMMERCPQ